MIEDKRTKLRTWLIQAGMTRVELAEKLGVTLASVNNWLSCTNIPERRWANIEKIFSSVVEDEEPRRNRIVGTTLSDEEYANAQKAAALLDMSFEKFFREALLIQVKKDLGEE